MNDRPTRVLPGFQGFPRRLARLRELGHISANQLSLLVGASKSTVANLEGGRSRTPRGDILVALAVVLGTTVEFLGAGLGQGPSTETVRTALEHAGYRRSDDGEIR